MDASLFQAIFLLTGVYTMSAKQMPLHVKKTVPYFNPRVFSSHMLTTNLTPIHGHPAGALLLKTYVVRPSRDGKTCEVEYGWDIAKEMGGIPIEKLYTREDHNLLPGVKDESTNIACST